MINDSNQNKFKQLHFADAFAISLRDLILLLLKLIIAIFKTIAIKHKFYFKLILISNQAYVYYYQKYVIINNIN